MPAVSYCELQVLLFLQDTLKATPESLGDARKETAEELAERHERVVAASLLALSSLLDLLVSKDQHDSPTGTGNASCTVHLKKHTLPYQHLFGLSILDGFFTRTCCSLTGCQTPPHTRWCEGRGGRYRGPGLIAVLCQH